MFTVVVTEKGGSRQTLKFDEEVISIGRVQGNEIVLPRGNVSKRHAKISYKDGQFIVTDAGSTNGTYLNGRRVQKPTRMLASDKLYVGDYIVALEGHDSLNPEQVGAEDSGPIEEIENIEDLKPIEVSNQEVVSFLDTPQGRATIEQEPKVAPTVPRPEAKEKPRGPSISIVPEKKAPRPKSKVKRPEVKSDDIADSKARLYTLVETIIDRVSREIKRVDKTRAPVKLDAGTSGQVRIIIDDIVSELVSRGKLPPDVDSNILKGKAFRSIVDLGPIEAWLDDDEVKMIRITKPSSAFLFREGHWSEAPNNFIAKEDMTTAIHCLGAGLQAQDAAAQGISRFRLEEGFRVFAQAASSGISKPSLFIDKTAAPMLAKDRIALKPEALKVLEETLKKSPNILVIGASTSTRITMLEAIIELIPAGDFVTTFEKVPFSLANNPRKLVLNGQSQSLNSKNRDLEGVLMSHALALETDWLAVGGTEVTDIKDVLRAATGRAGVIAELPLGTTKNLDLELAAALACAGTPLSIMEAAIMLAESFDYVVVAERDEAGSAAIGKICTGARSDKGRWSAKKLFGPKKDSGTS